MIKNKKTPHVKHEIKLQSKSNIPTSA
uniref:Uncharacterized protein n=1 Tax=Rhizophora mucronata TaxID=61149 RepID=A0A2P2N128_RHIMU